MSTLEIDIKHPPQIILIGNVNYSLFREKRNVILKIEAPCPRLRLRHAPATPPEEIRSLVPLRLDRRSRDRDRSPGARPPSKSGDFFS